MAQRRYSSVNNSDDSLSLPHFGPGQVKMRRIYRQGVSQSMTVVHIEVVEL
jgi:hypothetical protein